MLQWVSVCVFVCVYVCVYIPLLFFLANVFVWLKSGIYLFPCMDYISLHMHRSKILPRNATVMLYTAKFACNPCLGCTISRKFLHSVEDYLSRLNAKLVFEVLADPNEQHHGIHIIHDTNNLHNYPNNNNTVQFGGLSALLQHNT
jgi:hypothetical protein